MRGWHRESVRHALAARGIRSRAVRDPWTNEMMGRRILYRVVDADKLSQIFQGGKVSSRGFNEIYGGLAGTYNGAFGYILLVMDSDGIPNDMYPVEYTGRFFRKFPSVREMVRGHTDYDGPLVDLVGEEEYFSREPIRIMPDSVKEIRVYMNDYHLDMDAQLYYRTGKVSDEDKKEFLLSRIPKKYHRRIKWITAPGDWFDKEESDRERFIHDIVR
jgi:hypothetical protein